jgi:hypothetical protein
LDKAKDHPVGYLPQYIPFLYLFIPSNGWRNVPSFWVKFSNPQFLLDPIVSWNGNLKRKKKRENFHHIHRSPPFLQGTSPILETMRQGSQWSTSTSVPLPAAEIAAGSVRG